MRLEEVFGPRTVETPIIMAAPMPRLRPFSIARSPLRPAMGFCTAALLLGTIAPAAQADEPSPPPCPSSPAPVAATGATPPAAPRAPKSLKNAPIDVVSDEAILGADGNATLKGNVEVRSGDRQIRADQVQYDRNTGEIKSQGGVDFTDPLMHVTGEGGNYSPDGGAEFKSAQFELRQR